jgi:hypothetical protein
MRCHNTLTNNPVMIIRKEATITSFKELQTNISVKKNFISATMYGQSIFITVSELTVGES